MKKKDLAKYLGVNPSTLYRQTHGGGIGYRTAVKYGKKLRMPWYDIMASVEDGTFKVLLDTINIPKT